jgi:hypothetical protein
MAKSPKKSPTRTRVTRQSLERVLRPRKPTKALRELMRHKPVWDAPVDPRYDAICGTFHDMIGVNSPRGRTLGYAVLAKFGVKSVRDLRPKDYDACLEAARAAYAGMKALTTAEAENAKLVQQPGAKPSNPKDALGILKVPASTISAPVMSEVGVAMLEGALKYGRHNYRAIGVRASVYYDATVARHMALWWEGEDEDPDTCELAPEGQDTGLVNGNGQFVIPGTGLSHLTKAIAGLCVLRDAMIQGKFIDDRPPRSARGWQDKYNKMVKALLKKYPTPVPPYIEGDERMK